MAKVRIHGMKEVLAAIHNLPDAVREGARLGVLEAAGNIRDQAEHIAESANVQAGLYVQDASNDEIVRASVAIDMGRVPHALFEEMGTGQVANEESTYNGLEKMPLPNSAYTPMPWVRYDKAGKRFIYTRGRRARPYLYPAAQLEEPYVADTIKKAIEKAIHKQGGG